MNNKKVLYVKGTFKTLKCVAVLGVNFLVLKYRLILYINNKFIIHPYSGVLFANHPLSGYNH
jgi:hypothetical protein